MELGNPNDGDSPSAFSGPGRSASGGGYFFSCPASPVHYILASAPYTVAAYDATSSLSSSLSLQGPFEFDGVAASADRAMTSADELFVNGQIRPLKLSSHHQRLQSLAPLLDLEEQREEDDEEEEDGDDADERVEVLTAEGVRGRDLRIGSRSVHRRARSMSPARSPRFGWQEERDDAEHQNTVTEEAVDGEEEPERKATPEPTETEAEAAVESSSSSARNGKRWVFLKDFLYRSKSEGSGRGARANAKERFWHSISFSPSRSKSPAPPPATSPAETQLPEQQPKVSKQQKPPANGTARARRMQRRAVPSAHERHYAANRAQAEEMRRRTFLPYRQGLLLGCLGFSSRSYSTFHGLATTLSAVSSR